MIAWSAEKVFLFFAIFGGIVFVIRFALYFLGVAGDHGVPFSEDGGISNASQDAFNAFNLHNISAFCLIGGLVGYGCRQAAVSILMSSLWAAAAGVLAVFILTRIFLVVGRLQSDGTVHMSSALGQTAVVYLTIKPETGGQVQVHVQERLMTLTAYSRSRESIPTGTLVRVIDIQGDQLIVEAVNEQKNTDTEEIPPI